jgi:voltage-gated potassium channel
VNPFKRIIPSALILTMITVFGTSGYMILEGWTLLDSVYMVVITLFTIGFQEAHTLSDAGRIFTIFIIVGGVGTAVYAAGLIVEIIVEGHLAEYNRRKKMKKRISELKDHFIICGFGRVGRQVAEEFDQAGVDYVVVDRSDEVALYLEKQNIPYVIGDIINDTNLKQAGIIRARGMIANSDSDVANVFVTLSAKALNPELFVIARSGSKASDNKLKIAGADVIISPYLISGRKIAEVAIRPNTSEFLDILMSGHESRFSLREIPVSENSNMAGVKLSETGIRNKTGVMIVAVRKEDGTFNLQPDAGTILEKNEILVVIGTGEQLKMLEEMV